MALIKTTAVVDAISGKLNGTVFSHNKGGQYMRSRSLVANPQTNAQIQQRARMTGFSQEWRNLTEAQRSAWREAVDQWPYQNRLGDTKTLSGFGLYVMVNTNIALIQGTQLDTPMEKGIIRTFTGALQLNAQVFELNNAEDAVNKIEFDLPANSDHDEADRVLIKATPGISAGIRNLTNEFRMFYDGHSTGNSGNHITEANFPNIIDDYVARFGIPNVGSQVALKFQMIGTSGQRSNSMTVRMTVTAAES